MKCCFGDERVGVDNIDVSKLGIIPDRAVMSRFVDLQGFKERAEALYSMPNGFAIEYANAKRSVEQHPDYTSRFTETTPEIRGKNRYSDIICLDDCRVRLKSGQHDYINASFITHAPSVPPRYIAGQAPVEASIEDFWRMCWDYRVSVVAMLTPFHETSHGRTKVKADHYFPEKVGEAETYGDFVIVCKDYMDEQRHRGLVVRKFLLGNTKQTNKPELQLIHIHFTSWPDFGSVENYGLYLNLHGCIGSWEMIANVEEEEETEGDDEDDGNSQQQQQQQKQMDVEIQQGSGRGPLVVHCSAGIGRTGTYIAIDMILEQIRNACEKHQKPKLEIDIPKIVANLRNQRPMMVVTSEQYAMIYQVLYFAIFRQKLSAGASSSSSSSNSSKRSGFGTMKDNDIYRHLKHT